MLRQLDEAGECRYCHRPAWRADREGPLHPCCEFWKDVIAQGKPCPACAESRAAASRRLRVKNRRAEGER